MLDFFSWGLGAEHVLWPVCGSFLSVQAPLLIMAMISEASKAFTVPLT